MDARSQRPEMIPALATGSHVSGGGERIGATVVDSSFSGLEGLPLGSSLDVARRDAAATLATVESAGGVLSCDDFGSWTREGVRWTAANIDFYSGLETDLPKGRFDSRWPCIASLHSGRGSMTLASYDSAHLPTLDSCFLPMMHAITVVTQH